MNKKIKILYILIVYSLQFLNIIINLLFMQRLSISQLGSISLAKVFFQSADYTHLGTRFSLDRYVPVEKKEISINYSIWSSLICTMISIVVFLYILSSKYNSAMNISFFIGGYVVAQSNILKAYYRGSGNTLLMIKIPLFISVLPLLVITLVFYFDQSFYLFDYYMFPYVVFGMIFLTPFMLKMLNWVKSDLFSMVKMKRFISSSFLLMLNAIAIFSYTSLDRFVISSKYGNDFLGKYSIVIFAFSALLVLPSILSELIYPKIVQAVVKDKKIYFPKEILFILIPTFIAIIIANFLMDFFIIRFTEYSYLLKDIHLITWGVLPYCLSAVFYHVLNALDLRQYILYSNLLVLGFLCIGLYILTLFNIQDLVYFIWLKMGLGIVLSVSYLLFILFGVKCK